MVLFLFNKNEKRKNESDLSVNKMNVNTLRVECNIISGPYINSVHAHTIHQFALSVGPGYNIVEVSKNVIDFPVNLKEISSVGLKIGDQDNNLINFRDKTITISLRWMTGVLQP